MALTIAGGTGGARNLHGGISAGSSRRPVLFPPSSWNPPFWSLHFKTRNANMVAEAAKKLSYRTGKFDSKNRRNSRVTTKEEDKDKEKEQEQERPQQKAVQIETNSSRGGGESVAGADGYFVPELPGLEPDFWEGPQWDALGFVVQYMWAFGIVFALIACGIAVATYNEGATDFKETPAYKESVQSRDLLEEPEGSTSDVFESNPTEEAPSLE
ncbi:uncharacterized protein LOC127804558 [Diospyros lotus]|uniref:uncharacterized protein LOC127804558 n=1 Tax=Diospyros lotus TaxID=55363 RepID=UPI002253C25C|nr:uncharacterized protein LOC127804558 [Diospyros lotus]